MGKYQPIGVGMIESTTELGKFVREHRIALRLTQADLANLSSVSQIAISGLETGYLKSLADNRLKRIADALECDFAELSQRLPDRPPKPTGSELGERIRSRRKELGMSIDSLAGEADISVGQIERLENKKHPGLCYGLLLPLTKALELEPSELARFVGLKSKPTKSSLGNLIRAGRKKLGISLPRLADILDVSSQYVSQIERGHVPLSKSDRVIAQIAQVLQLDVEDLLVLRREGKSRKSAAKISPLGRFIATRRRELGLTQVEVREMIGRKSSYMSFVETGRLVPPPGVLEKLEQVLKCHVPADLLAP